jgi:hypothetical protein
MPAMPDSLPRLVSSELERRSLLEPRAGLPFTSFCIAEGRFFLEYLCGKGEKSLGY